MISWWLLACTKGGDTAQPVDTSPPVVDDTADPLDDDCAAITLEVEELDFSAAVETPVTLDFQVQNACTNAVDVAAEVDGDDAFSLGSSSVTLGPSSSGTFQVTYTPPEHGEHAGVVLLKTLDEQHVVQLAGATLSDADGDGFDDEAVGGEDCDDSDASVHPDAEELPYDELDSDCDGDFGDDVDGDGYDGVEAGGDDCDDEDPGVSPAAPESRNAVDDDCDGLADEGFFAAGDVFPTEILMDPEDTSDADGQWIELYNASSWDVNVLGWIFENATGEGIQVATDAVVPAGGYFVFAANPDTDENGGVSAGYGYGYANFPLGTAADELSAWAGGEVMFSVTYGEGWPIYAGRSVQLNPADVAAENLSVPELWCYATEQWDRGDRGTPGEANEPCSSLDQDGDGVSADDGDCDESDAAIFPGADEAWDGVDEDCDDVVDELAPGAADATVTASVDELLGYEHSLVVADLGGNGLSEVVVGGWDVGEAGGVYILPASSVAAGGAIGDLGLSLLGELGSGQIAFGSLPPELGDHDGDGAADLLVGGGGSGVVAAVFGGTSLGSDVDDALVQLTFDGASSNAASVAAGDLDGDGVDDVAWGSGFTSDAGYYEGAVAVWLADDSGEVALDVDADALLWGEDSFDYLGSALAAGDLDDDGYAELFVGARGDDEGGSSAGAIFVIPGSAGFSGEGSPEDLASAKLVGSRSNAELGRSIAARVADLDGDTAPDLVVGAHGDGEVWVFSAAGSLAGTVDDSSADHVLDGDDAGHFGFAVAVGELDGDGNSDLLITAPDVEDDDLAGATKAGEAWGVSGGSVAAGSVADLATASVHADSAGDGLGLAAALGDLDGDGQDDALVAAPGAGTLLLFLSP